MDDGSGATIAKAMKMYPHVGEAQEKGLMMMKSKFKKMARLQKQGREVTF